MPRVEARQKRRDRGKAETVTPRLRQGRGNNHEARQDRGEASKRRGEAEAALLLPQGCLEARLLPRDIHHCIRVKLSGNNRLNQCTYDQGSSRK